jgi:hypothetical protein
MEQIVVLKHKYAPGQGLNVCVMVDLLSPETCRSAVCRLETLI